MSDDKKVSVEDIPKFIERLIDYEGVDEYVSLCFKKENERLNNIINKAIEYIENTYSEVKNEDGSLPLTLHDQELLNILKGSDDDDNT